MSEKKISIISALSFLDSSQLSAFEDVFAYAENQPCESADKIKAMTLKRLRAARAASRMAKIRKAVVLAFAAALLCTAIIATVAVGALLGENQKGQEAPSGNGPAEDIPALDYETFDTLKGLEGYLKGEGKATPWGEDFEKTRKIPLLLSLASEQNSRFGLQYDSLEVITDDDSIGNGYVINLLKEQHGDIFSACLERGIDVKASFDEGQYSSGSVLINGIECMAVKIAEGGELNKYYVLYGAYLYELSAYEDDRVNDLQSVK